MTDKKDAVTVEKKLRGGFTQIYNAFLDSDILNQYEKLVFIAIKSFADNKTNKAYPSLATISRVTGTSISQVRRCIAHMEDLGILDIERRRSGQWGNIQNLYTIHDDPSIWNVTATEDDDIEAVAQEISDAKLIAELKKRGYMVQKQTKKEPMPGTDQSSDVDTFVKNQYSITNNNTEKEERQEKYSMKMLKRLYDYDVMANDYPHDQKQIEYILKIIYDTLNSNKETVRVQKTDRPHNIVAAELLDLTYQEIMYVIKKYNEQTDRIEHPKAYLLTQLYEAKGQLDADISNQVQHNMYGVNNEDGTA